MKLVCDGIEIEIPGGLSLEQVQALLSAKQDNLTGTQGQVVGFDANGKAVAQDGGGSSLEVYDGEERVIGTWINGRPLYRRAVSFTVPNGNAGTWADCSQYLSIDDLENIISLTGTVKNKAKRWSPVPYYDTTSNVQIAYSGPGDALISGNGLAYFGNNSSFYAIPIIVVVEYTKTTDQVTNSVTVQSQAAIPITAHEFGFSAAAVTATPVTAARIYDPQ